jgi:hypothetical protein
MIVRRGGLHDPKLKPKIQGDYCTWKRWLYIIFNFTCSFEHFKQSVANQRPAFICAGLVCRSVFYTDRLLFCSSNRANFGDARPF